MKNDNRIVVGIIMWAALLLCAIPTCRDCRKSARHASINTGSLFVGPEISTPLVATTMVDTGTLDAGNGGSGGNYVIKAHITNSGIAMIPFRVRLLNPGGSEAWAMDWNSSVGTSTEFTIVGAVAIDNGSKIQIRSSAGYTGTAQAAISYSIEGTY